MTVRQTYTAGMHTIASTARLREVARLMRDADVGLLAVMDGGTCVGVVTDRDLVVRPLADGFDASTPVAVAMSGPPATIAIDTPLEQTLLTMREGKHRRLLVVGDEGEPVGVVTIDDVLQRLGFLVHTTGEVLRVSNGAHRPTLVS
jgi:CBS domain-containing protein